MKSRYPEEMSTFAKMDLDYKVERESFGDEGVDVREGEGEGGDREGGDEGGGGDGDGGCVGGIFTTQ